ncbi:MAG: type I-U CRISPR-associated protein Csb2, partial [Acidimicrobiia bacterium]
MLRFDVELLLGTFRGAPADDLALTGRAVLAEWPPSPARLFSALVAAGGDERVAHAGALDLLEQAPAPSIDATTMVEHTPLHGRYVVEDRRAEGSVQEYPLR